MINKRVKVKYYKRVPVERGMSPKDEEIHEDYTIHDSWVNPKNGERYYLGANDEGKAYVFPAKNIISIISFSAILIFMLLKFS